MSNPPSAPNGDKMNELFTKNANSLTSPGYGGETSGLQLLQRDEVASRLRFAVVAVGATPTTPTL